MISQCYMYFIYHSSQCVLWVCVHVVHSLIPWTIGHVIHVALQYTHVTVYMWCTNSTGQLPTGAVQASHTLHVHVSGSHRNSGQWSGPPQPEPRSRPYGEWLAWHLVMILNCVTIQLWTFQPHPPPHPSPPPSHSHVEMWEGPGPLLTHS